MDQIIFSITTNGKSMYLLEDKVGQKTYKFKNFSDIIDVFTHSDHPNLPVQSRVVMPIPKENKVDIYQRMPTGQTKSLPKFFWAQAQNTFDQHEKVSVREVLKQIKTMKDW